MHEYLLTHRHDPAECAACFAAWNGFSSTLRRTTALASCVFGAHEIWWTVTAADPDEALAHLPKYVADRTTAARVAPVEIP
jgi:hypothetical protein